MKIWKGYGSEHSMNLVMIGQFKTIEEAEDANELIQELKGGLHNKIDLSSGNRLTRFPDEIRDLLRRLNFYDLRTEELEQFLYDITYYTEGNKLIFETDESDVSAFLKILVHKGAKVEVYSAHDYPNEP